MIWNMLVQLFVTGSVMLAQTTTPTTPPPSAVESGEILSYQCARSIASMVNASDQLGPLFAVGHLIFTSLEAKDSSKILLVNAGYGNYEIPLVGEGVNRIRFDLPTGEAGPQHEHRFFLSYLHGGIVRSRYFEFSESQPPPGHEDLDFAEVQAHRANYLLPHLDYAIHETAVTTLGALTEGRLTRKELQPHGTENCEHISRQSPLVARNLKYNLDLLDLIVVGPRLNPRLTPQRALASEQAPVLLHPTPH